MHFLDQVTSQKVCDPAGSLGRRGKPGLLNCPCWLADQARALHEAYGDTAERMGSRTQTDRHWANACVWLRTHVAELGSNLSKVAVTELVRVARSRLNLEKSLSLGFGSKEQTRDLVQG